MHNWSLLIVAFLAVFHPIASFTERNLVDGREQCCDLKPHLRERRLLYGTDVRGKALPDDRFLNQARRERRYAVRQHFALSSSGSDKTETELLERRIDTNQRGYRLERVIGNQLLARDNSQRNEPRDTRTERSVRNIEHARFTRQLDDRRIAREYSEASSTRLRDISQLSRQRITENRDSLDSRELQRNRELSRESNRHRYIRETRDVLQRTRDDLTRTRNDQRLVREIKRNVLNRPESRDIRAEEERRYLRLSDRRFSMQRQEARGDYRIVSLQPLNNDRRLRSLDRTDMFENRRERSHERRSSVIRSAVVGIDNLSHRSFDRSDRRLNINERRASPPNARVDNLRELHVLARDESRVSRSDERRLESRLENNNRERRSLSLSDRRLSRERLSVDRQRVSRERETRDESQMSRQMIERQQHRQREANDRTQTRSTTTDLRETSQRLDSRIRQLEPSESRRETRPNSGRDVTRNQDNMERRMSRSASTDREVRDIKRETRQIRVLDTRGRVPLVMEYRPEMARKDTRYRMETIRARNVVSVSSKSYSDDKDYSFNWQYFFYTMQAIYFCGVLYQMVTDNGADKAKSRFSWWKMSSTNLVKLD